MHFLNQCGLSGVTSLTLSGGKHATRSQILAFLCHKPYMLNLTTQTTYVSRIVDKNKKHKITYANKLTDRNTIASNLILSTSSKLVEFTSYFTKWIH